MKSFFRWCAMYLPLALLAIPQSINVGKWLYTDSSVMTIVAAWSGGMAFEAAYVGLIAWTGTTHRTRWFWLTALAALGFSVAIAVVVYAPSQKGQAWLHAGFPIVAFGYTMIIHEITSHLRAAALSPEKHKELLKQLAEFETEAHTAKSLAITLEKERDEAQRVAKAEYIRAETLRQENEQRTVTDAEIVAALASGAWPLGRIADTLTQYCESQNKAAQVLGTNAQNLSNWRKQVNATPSA